MRNLILILIDSIIFFIIPNVSFIFIRNLEEQNILINIVFLIVGLLVFIFTGVYKSILRYASTTYFYKLIIRIFLIIVFSFTILSFLSIRINDYRFWISSFVFNMIFICSYRIGLRDLISGILKNSKKSLIKKNCNLWSWRSWQAVSYNFKIFKKV